MDVLQAIEKRREITRFQAQPIPQELIDLLVRSLYLSPSGNNTPSREFILVTQKEMLLKLKETTPYMAWLESAAAAFVLVGNEKSSKYWLQDASIAGGYLWLTAVSLGLGAAWGAVYHSEDSEESAKREGYVRNLLQVPDEMRIVAVIGLGFPDMEPEPKEMYPVERVLHTERYGQ